jgi:glyoxylase-like metal-dependent hydrolase (beta-lactamase superfamily II)
MTTFPTEESMLHVTAMPLGPLDTNCYVLHSDREAVVIDPGGDADEIMSFLASRSLVLRSVLNTHLHFDHIQGNADLVAATGVAVLANPRDAYLMQTELGGGGMMGFPRTPPFEIVPLEEGELPLLGTTCSVLATPGHSPGSLSFYFESVGAVFVGDLIFYRSVGRTDFPGSSERELMRSVRTKIFTLPEDTVIYPGHGPETTVRQERLNNPFFTEFIR